MSHDPFADMAAAFPEFLQSWPILTDAERDAMADAYQAEQIASAQSEAAQEAARKEYE